MLNRILPRTGRFHCPDEHQLAAYVDQQLIGAERERVESHLAKCDWCLQQVGFLIKQSQMTAGPAPSSLMLRAKRLDVRASGKVFFDWKWISAAAAIVVVAIGIVVARDRRPKVEENSTVVATAQQPSAPVVREQVKSQADTAVRSISPAGSLPIVLSPQPGAVVHASDFMIRWEPVRNAAAYEVRVVTAEGDLVWSKRVQKNSVSVPKQVLRSGLKYFVLVRALLGNGKTQQSQAVWFIGG
jgi:anti-sigma factor RsiW